MKLIIEYKDPGTRILGLTAVEHFERKHLDSPTVDGVVYIMPHPKGDIVRHVRVEKGNIHVKITRGHEQSNKMRAKRDSGKGDIIIHEEDPRFGR